MPNPTTDIQRVIADNLEDAAEVVLDAMQLLDFYYASREPVGEGFQPKFFHLRKAIEGAFGDSWRDYIKGAARESIST